MSKKRMNGDEPSHPIYIWSGLLEPKHVKAIGPAIWLFLWCINRTTEERLTKDDGYHGWVFGGMPVTRDRISQELKASVRSVSRNLERLILRGYLVVALAPHGYIIRVRNSCRFPKEQEQQVKIIRARRRSGLPKVANQLRWAICRPKRK